MCGGVSVLFVGRVAVLEVCLLGVFRVLVLGIKLSRSLAVLGQIATKDIEFLF